MKKLFKISKISSLAHAAAAQSAESRPAAVVASTFALERRRPTQVISEKTAAECKKDVLHPLTTTLIVNTNEAGTSSSLFSSPSSSSSMEQKSKNDEQKPQGIVLVPRRLHDYLFRTPAFSKETIAQMAREKDCVEEKLKLPPLKSKNGTLMGHFEVLAREQLEAYHLLMQRAMAIQRLPPLPKEWSCSPGWTVYDVEIMDENGKKNKKKTKQSSSRQIPFPDEELLFFDVEVCMADGKLPTMAVALSPTNWYSWCSQRLADERAELPEFVTLQHLIQLEHPEQEKNLKKRLVIGHNVAFDRQFVREQYLQNESLMRFWCTMSMHIACSGMADHQRTLYEKSRLNKRDFMMAFIVEDEDGVPTFTKRFMKVVDDWKARTCKNSLEAVFKHYCGEEAQPLDKQWQKYFTKASIEEIRENAQKLFTYCASDVEATFQVYKKLYPKFCQRFPHPATRCGMMEMANAYLPITGNWHRFFAKCENLSSLSKDEMAHKVVQTARDMIEKLDQPLSSSSFPDSTTGDKEDEAMTRRKYQLDPWLWVSNWSRPAKRPEWPSWYWSLFYTKQQAQIEQLNELKADAVKLMCRELPRMFGLCFGPYPMLFVPNFGWGFVVPIKKFDPISLPILKEVTIGDEVVKMPMRAIYTLIVQNQIRVSDVITRSSKPALQLGNTFNFFRLPHPSGKPDMNVGTPFAKGGKMNFENFEEGVICPTRFSEVLQSFLASRSITRFWGNYRARYQEQLPVWFDERADQGAIVPSVIPAGTITRRAVHKLWLTSTNPKKEIIGSDLKSMVQCSDGWNLVGADVDSQEQWIAALFGDSMHPSKRAGATPFSAMLLAGAKATQTDLHSVVARQVGITREQAKVLNYARLYGSGILHAEQFLKTQGISVNVAKKLALKLFSTTKGNAGNFQKLTETGANFLLEYVTRIRKSNGNTNNKNSNNNNKNQNNSNNNNKNTNFASSPQYLLLDSNLYIPSIKDSQFAIDFAQWLLEEKRTNLNAQFASGYPVKLYKDGYESHTFNFLSLKSNETHPRTPILQCRLSEALEPLPVHKGDIEAYKFNQMYKRTIINWFVQSSAVDFLHMLLVCMRWLCKTYNIRARFVLSIHDEVRYLVAEEDKYRCALALSLSNMFVRAAISEALGIRELPRSIAFFSQVDIDTILRKEVSFECETPDGKRVEDGEALTIEQIVEKTGGSLQKSIK